MNYKLTPLAIIATFLFTIPGILLGGIAAFLYRLILQPLFDGNLVNWITGGWFETLSMAILPNVLHGAVGGVFAVWVSSKILKRANYEIVAYSVSTIVVAFTIIGLITGFARQGLDVGLVELISNTIGIVAGLFMGRETIKDTQLRLLSQDHLAEIQ